MRDPDKMRTLGTITLMVRQAMIPLPSRFLLILLLLLLSSPTLAVLVEAEGRAMILNSDLTSARRAAISDASQAASLQAAARIATTQQIRDGILEIDNLSISTLGTLSDVEVVDEWVQGQYLFVRIRARVAVETACPGGSAAEAYRKSAVITAFPLQSPAQANTGGLHRMGQDITDYLSSRFAQHRSLEVHNASQLNLYPNLATAPTQMLDDGALTSLQRHTEQMNVHYIISGVVRDLAPHHAQGARENNILVDLYNQLDTASLRHMRNFVMDLFIHDAFTGALIHQQQYATAGRWLLREQRADFTSAAFREQEYGQKVRSLLDQVGRDIEQTLRCTPFTARITRAENDRLWISAGQLSGLSVGDRLSVYRRYTHYDAMHNPYSELINTRVTLTLDSVQPGFASGTINSTAGSANIQQDDLVKSH